MQSLFNQCGNLAKSFDKLTHEEHKIILYQLINTVKEIFRRDSSDTQVELVKKAYEHGLVKYYPSFVKVFLEKKDWDEFSPWCTQVINRYPKQIDIHNMKLLADSSSTSVQQKESLLMQTSASVRPISKRTPFDIDQYGDLKSIDKCAQEFVKQLKRPNTYEQALNAVQSAFESTLRKAKSLFSSNKLCKPEMLRTPPFLVQTCLHMIRLNTGPIYYYAFFLKIFRDEWVLGYVHKELDQQYIDNLIDYVRIQVQQNPATTDEYYFILLTLLLTIFHTKNDVDDLLVMFSEMPFGISIYNFLMLRKLIIIHQQHQKKIVTTTTATVQPQQRHLFELERLVSTVNFEVMDSISLKERFRNVRQAGVMGNLKTIGGYLWNPSKLLQDFGEFVLPNEWYYILPLFYNPEEASKQDNQITLMFFRPKHDSLSVLREIMIIYMKKYQSVSSFQQKHEFDKHYENINKMIKKIDQQMLQKYSSVFAKLQLEDDADADRTPTLLETFQTYIFNRFHEHVKKYAVDPDDPMSEQIYEFFVTGKGKDFILNYTPSKDDYLGSTTRANRYRCVDWDITPFVNDIFSFFERHIPSDSNSVVEYFMKLSIHIIKFYGELIYAELFFPLLHAKFKNLYIQKWIREQQSQQLRSSSAMVVGNQDVKFVQAIATWINNNFAWQGTNNETILSSLWLRWGNDPRILSLFIGLCCEVQHSSETNITTRYDFLDWETKQKLRQLTMLRNIFITYITKGQFYATQEQLPTHLVDKYKVWLASIIDEHQAHELPESWYLLYLIFPASLPWLKVLVKNGDIGLLRLYFDASLDQCQRVYVKRNRRTEIEPAELNKRFDKFKERIKNELEWDGNLYIQMKLLIDNCDNLQEHRIDPKTRKPLKSGETFFGEITGNLQSVSSRPRLNLFQSFYNVQYQHSDIVFVSVDELAIPQNKQVDSMKSKDILHRDLQYLQQPTKYTFEKTSIDVTSSLSKKPFGLSFYKYRFIDSNNNNIDKAFFHILFTDIVMKELMFYDHGTNNPNSHQMFALTSLYSYIYLILSDLYRVEGRFTFYKSLLNQFVTVCTEQTNETNHQYEFLFHIHEGFALRFRVFEQFVSYAAFVNKEMEALSDSSQYPTFDIILRQHSHFSSQYVLVIPSKKDDFFTRNKKHAYINTSLSSARPFNPIVVKSEYQPILSTIIKAMETQTQPSPSPSSSTPSPSHSPTSAILDVAEIPGEQLFSSHIELKQAAFEYAKRLNLQSLVFFEVNKPNTNRQFICAWNIHDDLEKVIYSGKPMVHILVDHTNNYAPSLQLPEYVTNSQVQSTEFSDTINQLLTRLNLPQEPIEPYQMHDGHLLSYLHHIYTTDMYIIDFYKQQQQQPYVSNLLTLLTLKKENYLEPVIRHLHDNPLDGGGEESQMFILFSTVKNIEDEFNQFHSHRNIKKTGEALLQNLEILNGHIKWMDDNTLAQVRDQISQL